MAELFALSPFAGLLPRRIGEVTLSEPDLGPVASVAPFRGQTEEAAVRLGFALPSPDRVAEGRRAVWVGRGRWLVFGAVPDLADIAAVTDQSDAQAALTLQGAGAEATLARLVPLDLRTAAFPVGASARSMVGHMAATILREGPQTLMLMVLRSMAGTLLHEVETAATHVAARQAL